MFAIATGAMISSGLFILPGMAYARAGPAVIVSYLLAGLLAACGMLSIAELATAMPKAMPAARISRASASQRAFGQCSG